MNIQFREGSETLSDRLLERAQKKLTKLTRFIPEHDDEELVYVDVERESGATNSDSLWRSSINLEIPGESFNAVGTGESPDQATEIAIKDMKRRLRRSKGRRMSIARRGSELLKRIRNREVSLDQTA